MLLLVSCAAYRLMHDVLLLLLMLFRVTCHYSPSCLISGSVGTSPSSHWNTPWTVHHGAYLQGNLATNQPNVHVCGSGGGPQEDTEPLHCKETVSRPQTFTPLNVKDFFRLQ